MAADPGDTDARGPAPAPFAPNRWLVTITVTIGAISTILATTIVNVAIPGVMGAFGVGQDTAQWLASGFLAATTTAMLMADWFVRQLGRRGTYQLGMVVFILGSFIGVFADSIETVIAARIVQGAATGLIQPLTMVTIFEAFPVNERGKAMGIFGIGSIMAPSLGPYFGGVAIDAFDWHAVLLFPVPFCIISGIMGSFLLKPRDTSVARTNFDWLGFVLLVTFTFSLMTALSHGIREGWQSDFILTLFAMASVAFVSFLTWEYVYPNPLLNLRLFTIPAYAIVTVIAAVMGASLLREATAAPLPPRELPKLRPVWRFPDGSTEELTGEEWVAAKAAWGRPITTPAEALKAAHNILKALNAGLLVGNDIELQHWAVTVARALLSAPKDNASRDDVLEALIRLADAADAVGIRFFDTDTMEPEVEEMQAATKVARRALKEKPL